MLSGASFHPSQRCESRFIDVSVLMLVRVNIFIGFAALSKKMIIILIRSQSTKPKQASKMIKIQAVLIAVIASCALASNDRHPNDGLQRGDASGWSGHGRSLKGAAPGVKAAPGKAKRPLDAGKAGKGKTAPGAPPSKSAKSKGKLNHVAKTGSGNQPSKESKPHAKNHPSAPKVTSPNDLSGGKSNPSNGHPHNKPQKDNQLSHGGKTIEKGGKGTASKSSNGSSHGKNNQNKDKTANPAGEHTIKPTQRHNKHHPHHKPAHKPVAAPTSASTSRPTLHPTMKPTAAPSPIPTQAPTAELTQGPTFKPTHAPSQSPSAYPSVTPSYMPSDAPSSAPSDMPSSAPSLAPTTDFMQACRCDATGICLSQALLQGTDLNICVFSRQPYDILTIESAELISGDFVQMVLAPDVGNSTGVFRSCLDQVCTIQTPVPSSYFQPGKTSSMFVHGVVLLQGNHNSRRAVRFGRRHLLQQKGIEAGLISMEFSASISLGLSIAEIGGGQNQGQDGNNGAGHHPPVVAWLLPVLAVVLAITVGLVLFIRRRQTHMSQGGLE